MTKVLTLTLILFLGLVVTDVSSQAIGAGIPDIVIGYCEAYNTCTLRCRSVCLGMPILFPFWGVTIMKAVLNPIHINVFVGDREILPICVHRHKTVYKIQRNESDLFF